MNTKIAGAAIADPPRNSHGREQIVFHAPASCFFHLRKGRTHPMVYPPMKVSDAARIAYYEAKLQNLRVYPQCFVGKDANEVEKGLVWLQNLDLDASGFTQLHLAEAEAVRTFACSQLKAMLDGKRDAFTKAARAWEH